MSSMYVNGKLCGGNAPVDQIFDENSNNAQSGKAVKQAIASITPGGEVTYETSIWTCDDDFNIQYN